MRTYCVRWVAVPPRSLILFLGSSFSKWTLLIIALKRSAPHPAHPRAIYSHYDTGGGNIWAGVSTLELDSCQNLFSYSYIKSQIHPTHFLCDFKAGVKLFWNRIDWLVKDMASQCKALLWKCIFTHLIGVYSSVGESGGNVGLAKYDCLGLKRYIK